MLIGLLLVVCLMAVGLVVLVVVARWRGDVEGRQAGQNGPRNDDQGGE